MKRVGERVLFRFRTKCGRIEMVDFLREEGLESNLNIIPQFIIIQGVRGMGNESEELGRRLTTTTVEQNVPE